jgi:hypothetical protein
MDYSHGAFFVVPCSQTGTAPCLGADYYKSVVLVNSLAVYTSRLMVDNYATPGSAINQTDGDPGSWLNRDWAMMNG